MAFERLNNSAAWLAAYGTRAAAAWNTEPSPDACKVFEQHPPDRRALFNLTSPGNWSAEVANIPGYKVILDGVVYNRGELDQDLDPRLTPAASNAEAVAHAYSAWGEGALQRIKGVFALIIWDRAHDRLLCARDRLGMHPLFYAKTAQALLIAPTIDTLLDHPEVTKNINRPRLVEYLARRWTKREETCFTGIHRVPPGHVLSVHGVRERIFRYWNPLPPDRPIEWIPDDEAATRFSTLFTQAVERSLDCGPASVLLSGGLDSSAVAMVATDICRRTGAALPWAISLTTPAPVDDEAAGQAIANDLDIPRFLVSHADAVGSNGMTAAALDLTRALPAPMFNVSAPVFLALSFAAAQRGCRAILTGEGADDWMGMSPLLAANMLRASDVLGILRLSRTLNSYYVAVRWAGLHGVIWRYAMRPALRRAWDASGAVGRSVFGLGADKSAAGLTRAISPFIVEPWFAPDGDLRAELARRVEDRSATVKRSTGVEDGYRRVVLANLDSPGASLRAEEAFLLGRHSRVRQQDPFWDADLIDLAVRIRPSVRSRGGVSKALLRDALVRRFPQRAFDRQRKGPLRALLLQPLLLAGADKALRALGKNWVLGELGVVDPKRAIEFVNHPPEGKGWRAWDLINLETWVRSHY